MKGVFKHIRGDFFGGITAGIVSLPSALAFGVQSGLGAAAGLYSAIFIGFFAALFGGTSTQISGPTAPMTVVTSVLVAGVIQFYNGNFEKALPTIIFIFVLAGLIQIGLGALKIGSLIKYIPYPVVSGFMTGIGVIILITQIFPLMGYNPTKDLELEQKYKPYAEEILLDKILKEKAAKGILVLEDYQETVVQGQKFTSEDIDNETKSIIASKTKGVNGSLLYAKNAIKNINFTEFILTLLTIGLIYLFKRYLPKIPAQILALVVVSLSVYLFHVDAVLIQDRSPIPSGFPKFQLGIFNHFSFSSIYMFIGAAITLAGLGSIDSLLTSVVSDNITKTKHKSNKELIGQGIGNTIAALFGGLPGAGATIRTVVNINNGGKTKISGMIHSVLILLVLIALGPIASQIPLSVLAGILITVGIGVMDYKGLKALRKIPKTDAFILLLVLVVTVFFDLITAVLLGLTISCVLFMKSMSKATNSSTEIAKVEGHSGVKKIGIKGPLFFGMVQEFKELIEQIPKDTKYVIINMTDVPYIDQSGLYAIEDNILSLEGQNIQTLMVAPQEQPVFLMKKIDLIPSLMPKKNIFSSVEEAKKFIVSKSN